MPPCSSFRALVAATIATVAATSLLDVDFGDNATFSVSLGGIRWLESAPLRAFAGGAWQNLAWQNVARSAGSDALGEFECVNVTWSWSPGGVLHTSLKTYAGQDMAVFTQQLPLGASGTNASNPVLPSGIRVMDPGDYPPVVSFPSFGGGQLQSLGYLTWQSRMVTGEWGTNVTDGPPAGNEPLINGRGLQGLSTSGPVVLFDAARQFASLVISPLDNFKSAVHHARTAAGGDTVWETGVTSELVSLPAGFEHRTLLVAGSGVTATLARWGKAVQAAHSTNRSLVETDRNLKYLSYWTDNGAYYSGGAWGEAGGGGDPVNETAFRAVAAGLKEQELFGAVHIWQLDDWWYHGRASVYSDCVLNWSLPTATFPSGLKKLSADLGKPWLLYVPFWCPENVHADDFRWIHSSNPGHPELVFAEPHPDDAVRFYRYLFDYGIANGMAGYEQDYLDYNYLAMPYLRKNYGAADKWLGGMNLAALERDVPVQACMALPSDLMASVQLDSFTNYRCSTDYGIDDSSMPLEQYDDNINIGTSSLFGWALGLRPSKDIFWTRRPDNCRNADPTTDPKACGRWGAHTNAGSNCELNAIVATLSTGPVGIADKAGSTNASLISRCIRQDGRILQPDKPATTVDSLLAREQATAPPGMVTATSTVLGSLAWHYVLSVDVAAPFKLAAGDLYPRMEGAPSTWVLHSWFSGHHPTGCVNGSLAVASGCLAATVASARDIPAIHNTRPIMVENDTHTFDLVMLAPVASNGWAFLGEVGAYVSVSSDRFDSVHFSASGIIAAVSGAVGETIELVALRPTAFARGSSSEWEVLVRSVTVGKSGRVSVTF